MEIKYRPGAKLAHVDALSRVVMEDKAEGVEDVLFNKRYEVCTFLTLIEIKQVMQWGDETTKMLIGILQKEEFNRTKYEKSLIQNFKLRNGILYREVKGRELFVVPRAMRKGITIAAHDHGGHFALDRTVIKIMEDYWFLQLRRYVRQHIQMCIDCVMTKKPAGKPQGVLHPIPPGLQPFYTIHMDHLGPFETSVKGNRYLLVIVDNLTNYVLLYPTRSTDTRAVI